LSWSMKKKRRTEKDVRYTQARRKLKEFKEVEKWQGSWGGGKMKKRKEARLGGEEGKLKKNCYATKQKRNRAWAPGRSLVYAAITGEGEVVVGAQKPGGGGNGKWRESDRRERKRNDKKTEHGGKTQLSKSHKEKKKRFGKGKNTHTPRTMRGGGVHWTRSRMDTFLSQQEEKKRNENPPWDREENVERNFGGGRGGGPKSQKGGGGRGVGGERGVRLPLALVPDQKKKGEDGFGKEGEKRG